MKLWHSLLLCLVILCNSVFASQRTTQAIASQANNQHWFLYADDIIKFDGHNKFNAQQLTHDLTAPFLSILSQAPFLWVGHQNGLTKINTVTGETRTWLQTPVTKINQTNNGIIFQSNERLYQLVNTTLSVLPIDLKQQLWQASPQGVVYVSEDKALMRWDMMSGKQQFATLPFDTDTLLLHQDKVILKSLAGEVFLFDKTLQTDPLFSADNLVVFDSNLVSFKGSFINSYNLNTQTQYQYQVNNLPIDDLKVSDQSIWLSQLGQWHKFQPAQLNLQTDIENSEELKLYQIGMRAFQQFAKSQPVNAVRYIDGGRWAVATEQQIFIFSGEKGSFTPFIDKQNTQALYFTHDGNLWVRDNSSLSQFDMGSKTLLHRYDIESIHSITQLSDCLLYTSPSPRDRQKSRMPSSA